MERGLAAMVREVLDETVNGNNPGIANELFHPKFVSHTSFGDYDLEGFKVFVTAWRDAVPDLEITLEDIDEDGDEAWWTVHITGTPVKELFGIPPSGKRVDVRLINCVRAIDGRPVEHWVGGQLDEILRARGTG